MEQTKGIQEIFLDFHQEITCKEDQTINWMGTPITKKRWCSKKSFLFSVFNKYVIIHYNGCCEDLDHLTWKKELIDIAVGKCDLKYWYEIERSYHVNDDFTKFRTKQVQFKERLNYVNYLYYDNRMKRYGFVTTVDFVEQWANNDELTENTQNALEYIRSNPDLKHFEDDIIELYSFNKIGEVLPMTVVKTTDELIKQIKQLTK